MRFEEAMDILAGTGRPAAMERVTAEVEALRIRAEAAEAKVAEIESSVEALDPLPVPTE